ncbi:hypothetical protein EMPG_17467 [Blastomyces silverae]|uniref:Uncharacterized protein n=1 Tax=Blastomyces silverae TaxID=2060906 RepID=A0A0H1B7R9_9EURO|nr:hypothetical protein EMPG_17467 [Blastomyces silverae]
MSQSPSPREKEEMVSACTVDIHGTAALPHSAGCGKENVHVHYFWFSHGIIAEDLVRVATWLDAYDYLGGGAIIIEILCPGGDENVPTPLPNQKG